MSKKISILKLHISILAVFALPLILTAQNTFIENKGQLPQHVKAKVLLPSGALFVEEGKLTYAFYSSKQLSDIHDLIHPKKEIKAHSYVVEFINSNTNFSTQFLGQSDFYENYFLGDKSTWATNVKSYRSLNQKNIYNGIDIEYYIKEDNLKYDFIVSPQTLTNQIKIKYNGVEKITLDEGSLLITTSVNTIKEYKPYAYQNIKGKIIEVNCEYTLKNQKISFYFPDGYDEKHELIIDPILEFSTYSGSTTDNFGYTATYDDYGFLYAGSTAFGAGYPTTIGAYQIDYANNLGGTDVAITKYDTSGTQRIYSTYLGGGMDELPHSMIVNSVNELFVFGTTGSSDFPTTNLVFQPNFKGGPGFTPSGIGVSFPSGSDIFVSRISADGGNLLASTFVGGSGNDGLNTAVQLKYNYADEVRGEIDIDQQNNIYIATCTNSSDFPASNSFQNSNSGGQEGCVVKMDNQLSTIIWSAYLGGVNDDAIYSLALNDNDDIYVTGGTNSSDFPTTINSYQDTYQDSLKADGFVTKISASGSQIIASSYFGTEEYDQSYFVEIGETNSVYLFGQTKAPGTQLIYNASYSVLGGGQFIAILNEDLSFLLRSTVVGSGKGTPDISPTAFLVDVCDKIYFAGWGSNLGGPLSTLNLPVSADAYQQDTDGNDIYLMVLDGSLNAMIYSTYFGGSQSNEHVDGGTSRFDKKGIIYQSVCAGCGGHSDFPIEPIPGAVSTTNNSPNCNNGVFKFNFNFPMVVADFDAPWVVCDTVINFQNQTLAGPAATYIWDFGGGNMSNDINPTHTFTQNGTHTIMLIANDNNSCNVTDTIIKEIYILSNTSDSLQNVIKCPKEQIQIGLLPINNPIINYFWFPSLNLSSPNISNPFCDTDTDIEYQLLISDGSCIDTLFQSVVVTELDLFAGLDTLYCNTPILLSATYSNEVNEVLWSSNRDFQDTLSVSGSLIISSPGIFYIQVSDGNCIQIDSLEVFSNNTIDVSANNICFGDSTLIELENLTPINPIISYSWNTTNLDTFAFFDFPEYNTWYVVEAVNSEGCIIKDSVFVEVYEYPVVDSAWASDYSVFVGQEVVLNINTSYNVNWLDFFNTNTTQSVFPVETKCYQFEAYNYFCIINDSLCIEAQDVFCDSEHIKIPTAFSPNGDNINDTYFIEDKDGIVISFKLEIFNRLGQKVFFTRDVFEHWDGTFRNNILNPQVFDFYMDLECIGGKSLFYKGNITLIR